MTLLIAVATGQIVIGKKLQAQSLCVKTAMGLQSGLGRILGDLLSLNPEATRLRGERVAADARLAAAVATGMPPAIAAAKAHRLSVILRQGALRARQKLLIAQAEARVLTYSREIQAEARKMGVIQVKRKELDRRALAVSPQPPSSPSPSYQLDPPFMQRQAKFFVLQVPLRATLQPNTWNQITTCGTTLNKKEKKWRPQIVQASALSKPPWRLLSL